MTLWNNNQGIISYSTRAEQALFDFLPSDQINPSHLHKAMHYAVFNGGKRLRPLLVYTTGSMLNVPLPILDRIAAAIEYVHCYSLVHDDLPCMDNSDLRRGKPSTHKAFDEATAVLVGDALQCLSFEILSATPSTDLSPLQTLEITRILAKSIGSLGMAGGQMLDLLAVDQQTNETNLKILHEMKTGKLLQACIEIPMICADIQDENVKTILHDAAKKLGFAFQVQDDLLDYTSCTKTLGKPQGQDKQANKSTFATVMPFEQADALVDSLYESVITTIRSLHYDDQDFLSLIEGMATRKH